MAKKNIREEIWDLLIGKGFKVSNHSDRILWKEKTISNPDSSPDASREKVVRIKYRFGANNLQKFTGDFKNYSVPFCRLAVIDGKITKVKKWKKDTMEFRS